MKNGKKFCQNFLNFRIYINEIDKSFYQNLIKEEIDKNNFKEKNYNYARLAKTLYEFDNLLRYYSNKEVLKVNEKVEKNSEYINSLNVAFLIYTSRLETILDKIIRK